MKVQRTIPPAAAPLYWRDLFCGFGGIFSGEKSVQNFEAEIKEYFGVQYVFAVSSGKAALALILRALKTLSSKNEVLIPAYTCFSVPSAIVKAGLKVKLCDIDPATLDFDYKMLEKRVNENTLCVVPNHLFGIPSDLDRIQSLCRVRGIYVVEDAAQAMGGVYKGNKLGTIGDVGFFSFGRGKNITCGSGGVILTHSQQIASAIEKEYSGLERPTFLENMKEFVSLVMMKIFIYPALFWFPNGLPFLKLGETFFYTDFPMKRFSGIKSGWMRKWKERLERSKQDRAENGAYFIKSLRAGIPRGNDIPYLRLPIVIETVEKRNRIYSLSRERGLGLSVMYPTAVNEIEEIKADFKGEAFPSAKEIAEKLLTVPVHALVSDRDKRAITELVNSHC
ncbi:MAG: aminotransferase class V-fold PLP-dependent enzyme [Candidatus Manganitrophaceae bacterium]|nr:MAG: aminotransferase class V-fold PLP-dependent enzyme [Candidatus Manganitrophaceae bacterium]